MRNTTLISAIAAVLSAKFTSKRRETVPEPHFDCMSSYGPIGCYRVRCQLGKKCQAAIDAEIASAKDATGQGDAL